MVTKELLSYIKEQTQAGYTKGQLLDVLHNQGGWDVPDIEEAFAMIEKDHAAPVKPQAPIMDMQRAIAEQQAVQKEESVQPAQNTQTPEMRAQNPVREAAPRPAQAAQVVQEVSPKPVEEKPDVTASISPAQQEPVRTPVVGIAGGNAVRNTWREERLRPQKKKGGLLKGILIFLVIVLIGVGGAYGYTVYIKGAHKTPAEVLGLMFENLYTTESLSFENTFDVGVAVDMPASFAQEQLLFATTTDESLVNKKEHAEFSMSGKSRGSMDSHDEKYSADVNHRISFLGEVASFLDFNISFDLDYKVVDDILYVRLNDITGLPDVPFDVKSALGNWYSLDLISDQGIRELSQVYKDEDIALIRDFFASEKGVAAIERSVTELADEEVAGQAAYHYRIQLSQDDWKSLIEQSIRIAKEDQNLTEAEKQDFVNLENFLGEPVGESVLEALASLHADVLITKKDFLPRTITIAGETSHTFTMKDVEDMFMIPSDVASTTSAAPLVDLDTEEFNLKFHVTSNIVLEDFGKVMPAQEPTDAKSLEEAFGINISGGVKPHSPELIGMSSYLELYKTQNSGYPEALSDVSKLFSDTDKDFFELEKFEYAKEEDGYTLCIKQDVLLNKDCISIP